MYKRGSSDRADELLPTRRSLIERLRDLDQETVIGVARKMPEFNYDPSVCSFKGWLMHVTRCRIADRFRRRRPQNVPLAVPQTDTAAEAVPEIVDPAADVLTGIWNEEWQKNIMDVAMERVRRSPWIAPPFPPAR